jgi:hypothetical protein
MAFVEAAGTYAEKNGHGGAGVARPMQELST